MRFHLERRGTEIGHGTHNGHVGPLSFLDDCMHEDNVPRMTYYTSRFFTSSAFSSIKRRRLSTSSPISVEKITSLSVASSSLTWSSVRLSGFMVVSASCSAFISPRPL